MYIASTIFLRLQTSTKPTFQKMHKKMLDNQWTVEKNDEGVTRWVIVIFKLLLTQTILSFSSSTFYQI